MSAVAYTNQTVASAADTDIVQLRHHVRHHKGEKWSSSMQD